MLATIIATLVVAAAETTQPGARDAAAADAAAVRTILDQQVTAWNDGDLEAFMATYWRSPDLVYQSNASVTRGWEPTLARYRQRYKSEGRQMGQLRFEGAEVQVLAAGVAFARGGWHLTFADGKDARGLFTLVIRRVPEQGWRIVHDHSSGE